MVIILIVNVIVSLLPVFILFCLFVKCCVVFVCLTLVGGVTPLAPISMQEMHKLEPGSVLDPSSLSPVPYHTGKFVGFN